MRSYLRSRVLLTGAVAACAVALSACGGVAKVGSNGGAAPSSSRAAPALGRLHAQANLLLDGGISAFRSRLDSLRGVPLVVNQWASWCGPCRFEFPFFQRLARRYDGRVAFLGVDAEDARSDAAQFLKKLPVSYPHYFDENASIARTFGGGRSWPTPLPSRTSAPTPRRPSWSRTS